LRAVFANSTNLLAFRRGIWRPAQPNPASVLHTLTVVCSWKERNGAPCNEWTHMQRRRNRSCRAGCHACIRLRRHDTVDEGRRHDRAKNTRIVLNHGTLTDLLIQYHLSGRNETRRHRVVRTGVDGKHSKEHTAANDDTHGPG
jgi:hypothetical protein